MDNDKTHLISKSSSSEMTIINIRRPTREPFLRPVYLSLIISFLDKPQQMIWLRRISQAWKDTIDNHSDAHWMKLINWTSMYQATCHKCFIIIHMGLRLNPPSIQNQETII